MSRRSVAASISADIGTKAHIELQILALRKGHTIREVAGELLDSLFEEIEETSSFKFADVQLLQQQVKSLEAQMEKLSAQLEAISQLAALNSNEPNPEASIDTDDGEELAEESEQADAVQEALHPEETPAEPQESMGVW